MPKKTPAVEQRIVEDKERMLEQLGETPFVTTACKKTGIGRATYYRWIAEDKQFRAASEKAQEEGNLLLRDMAESVLISLIKDRNFNATRFYLMNKHPDYKQNAELERSRQLANDRTEAHNQFNTLNL